MTTSKKAIMLRKESEARAKAEEKLKAVVDARASIEQKATAQVERKLHTQQLRFGDLIQKIEAQVNEEIAKANDQLQELLEKVRSYKAEVEQKKEKLIEAQTQLKAETAAKIKTYESLRIERHQRRKAQARLTGNITEVEAKPIVKPVGFKRHTRTGILHAEVINNYKLGHQFVAHSRRLKWNIALLSVMAIFSFTAIVLVVDKVPFTGKSVQEETRESAPVKASIVSDIKTERPTDIKTAGLSSDKMSSSAISTTSTSVLKTDGEAEAELKVSNEKRITDTDNQPTIKEERKFPKIITSANSHIVQSSDDDRWELSIGRHVSYAFSEISIPANATIKSVVVFIEHCEEERFIEDRLEWMVGTGWPNKPEVWAAIKAPIHRGEFNENVDTWDVTGVVDTVEKIKTFQLHVKNNSYSYKSKALMDYAYVVIEYD
jgi:hypothetical protein